MINKEHRTESARAFHRVARGGGQLSIVAEAETAFDPLDGSFLRFDATLEHRRLATYDLRIDGPFDDALRLGDDRRRPREQQQDRRQHDGLQRPPTSNNRPLGMGVGGGRARARFAGAKNWATESVINRAYLTAAQQATDTHKPSGAVCRRRPREMRNAFGVPIPMAIYAGRAGGHLTATRSAWKLPPPRRM